MGGYRVLTLFVFLVDGKSLDFVFKFLIDNALICF